MTEHKKLGIITTILKLAFVIGVIAALVYLFMQVTGLKNRMTTAENRLNEGTFYYDDGTKSVEGQTLQYTLDDQKDGTANVEVFDPSQTTSITYKEKKVRIYNITVTNPADYSIDVDSTSIRAKTDKGQLISPSTTKEQTQSGETTFTSLAPGGTKKLTLYFVPVEGETFVGLYDYTNNKEIK